MNSVVFLVVIPLIAAFLALFSKDVNKIIAYVVSVFNLVFSIAILVSGKIPFNVAIGGWKAPFGINFVITSLSIYFLVLVNTGALLALTVNYSKKEYQYYSFFFVLLAATNGMVLTGDLFNFFLFTELATFAIGALVAYKKDRLASGAALKYLILSSTASFFMLGSIGIIYKTIGTLNFADIASKVSDFNPATLTLILVLLLGSMLVELKIFPFNIWVPRAYQASRTSVNLFLHGMLGTAGVYAAIRVILMVFGNNGSIVQTDVNMSGLLTLAAVLTVIISETGALSEKNIKKVLAFSTMAQMGMILFGIALGNTAALEGVLFITLSNFLSKFILFSVSEQFSRASGSLNYKEMKGIGRKHPLLAIAFTAAALSLMGIPFFAGFWGKLSIISSAVTVGGSMIFGVVVILAASVIEGVYFLRIAHTFFTENEKAEGGSLENKSTVYDIRRTTYILPAALAILVIIIGIYPHPVQQIISSISDEVTNSTAKYINLILSSR